MNWTNLWMKLFGRTAFLGLDMGFWVSMTVVLVIVIAMNIMFWCLKPLRAPVINSKATDDRH